MRDIFFGNEDNRGARFIQLEDCGHVLEVKGLDQWMDLSEYTTEGAVDVQLKCCPKCKTPVRRSRRYGAIINRTLADVEQVKSRMIGDTGKIASAKQNTMKPLAAVGTHLSRFRRAHGMSAIGSISRFRRPVRMNIDDLKTRVRGKNLSLEEATCLSTYPTCCVCCVNFVTHRLTLTTASWWKRSTTCWSGR